MSTCRPVYQVDWSRGKYRSAWLYGYSVLVDLSTCQPVNLSTRVDRSRNKYRSAWLYKYSVLVDLSTCLPGLTDQEVNKGMQSIMGISYMATCRPVNLSTRVDRSRCKHIISYLWHYAQSVLVHLSSCRPANQTWGQILWKVFKYITVTFTDQWLQLHYNYRACRNVMITIIITSESNQITTKYF